MDEHARALDLVREQLIEARAGADTLFLLPLLLRQGHIEVFFGNTVESEIALVEARDLASSLPDSAALLTSTRWLAVALNTQGRLEEGYATCVELLALSRLRRDLRHEGWAHVGIAWYEETSGQTEASADSYQLAAQAFHESHDAFGECWARNGLGVALGRLGRFEESRLAFEDVVRQAAEIRYTLAEALARTNLGALEWNLGDPGEAEKQFEQLLRLHREIGSAREAVVPELDLARCEWSLGKRSQASTRLEALLGTCVTKEWRDYEGKVLRHLAELREEQSRPQAAISLYRRALDLGSGLAAVDRVESLIGWSDALAGVDSLDAALAILDLHLAELRDITQGELALELEERRGQRLLELGRFAEAIDALEPAEAWAESLGLGRMRVPMLAAIGRAWRELGEPDTALVYYWKARNVWREERRVPREPEWREQRGVIGRLVYTDLADLLLEHPRELPPEERARRAWETIREFKARTLLERRLGPDRAVDMNKADPLSTNGESIEDESVGASGASGRSGAPGAPGASRAPGAPGAPGASRAPGAPGASGAPGLPGTLARGEILLDYYLGPHTSLLFVVEGERIDVHHLAPEDSLVRIARMFAELVSQPPTEKRAERYLPSLVGARRTLLALFPGDLGARIAESTQVVCSADGALHLLPFSILGPMVESVGGARGRSEPASSEARGSTLANDATGTFPFAEKDWCSVPTLQMLEQIRAERRDGRELLGILALAGGDSAQEPLPGARREVRRLRERYREVSTSPRDPDTDLPLASLAGFDVIHIASHARTYDEAPWRSIIDCDLGGDHSGICAEDVARARLDARLAVLSSCRSAGGRVLTGEGIQGLSSAFLASRVSAVVATLWPVEDRSAAQLMEHFYAGLEEGRSVSAALRLAQKRLRERKETAHPFFWAGFVVVGDGGVEVPVTLRPARERWPRAAWRACREQPWLAAGLGLIVLLGSAIGWRRFRAQRRSATTPAA